MLGYRVAMRYNALKATRASVNIGGSKCLCKISTTSSDKDDKSKNAEFPSLTKEGDENLSDSRQVSSHEGKASASRRALKEINANGEIDGGELGGNTISLENKTTVMREMLLIEQHHIEEIVKDSSGKVRDVVWCPSFVRSGLKDARGGDEISHHKCKSCQRISFHLLNDGEKYRPCLRCAGWSEEDIPSWYYHNGCNHCQLIY